MTLHRRIGLQLTPRYGEREAKAMTMALLEDVAGLTPADVLAGRADALPMTQQHVLLAMARRMAGGEPYQYVVGWQRFRGLRIGVRPGVLIPRPETEELVDWAVEWLRPIPSPSVADAGTGSGCIALALKHARPDAQVEAWDISTEALAIARTNAQRLKLDIAFHKRDVLEYPPEGSSSHQAPQSLDGIVSNPPYVCESERAGMEPNVLDNEPGIALFVPDDDPLLFHRALAHQALRLLRPGGFLMVEINRLFGQEVVSLFRACGLAGCSLRHDQLGNPRMVAARKPR